MAEAQRTRAVRELRDDRLPIIEAAEDDHKDLLALRQGVLREVLCDFRNQRSNLDCSASVDSIRSPREGGVRC